MIRSDIKVNLRRASAAVIAILLTATAVFLFHGVVTSDGVDALDIVRLVLLAISSAWLAWGFVIALYGLIFSQTPSPRLESMDDIRGRTAILLPIYNEDVVDIVANLTAMYEDLDRLGARHQFDFHVLSDSNKADKITLEKSVFKRIITDLNAGGSIFYRHRPNNVGRKAGNIADFIKASGAAYEYMLVLDADSLMRGHTIIEMAKRMEADPKLGLLQSLPIIKGLNTLFGRAQQFSTVFYSPTFSNGLASLQGNEGNFWGHNAIIRVKAFASACGLPSLSGRPPFGGHIISHDFVEATLLIRAGWSVRLDPDLVGSYEEGPSNMLEYAKRDRRWCQGNLQHSRIITANGLSLWSRVALIQGIMAYLASPVWLLFLLTSVAAQIFAPDPVYFPNTWNLFPVFPHIESEKAYALISGILVLLIAPKTIILAKVMLSQLDKDNTVPKWSVLLSGTAELIISSMFAPIHMMYQCKSVAQILIGQDSGWPATDRNDNYMPLNIAFKSAWWISLTGIIVTAFIFIFAPELLLWVSPIVIPLILSPFIITLSSSQKIGRFTARLGLFLTPSELSPDVILTSAHDYQQRYARASSYTLSS